MKQIKLFLISTLLLFGAAVNAQPFFTIGGGASSLFVQSDELKRFRDTYNAYHAGALAQEMRGIGNGALGYRLEAGFRHFNKLHLGLAAGFERHSIRDGAEFGNREKRDLKITFNGIFTEVELGKQFGQYFVNGAFKLTYRRSVEIESTYSGRDTLNANSLDGNYEGSTLRSAYLGISTGAYRSPLFINVKFLYPVYSNQDDTFIESADAGKRAENTQIFPSDFREFATQPTYRGVHSDVNGYIISVSLLIALPL